jgi:hypothetical protein
MATKFFKNFNIGQMIHLTKNKIFMVLGYIEIRFL